MFLENLGFLGFGSCFQKTKGFGSWLMFLEDQGFLDLGSCFQRTKGSWILAHGVCSNEVVKDAMLLVNFSSMLISSGPGLKLSILSLGLVVVG